jgi:hypothetical protein
MLIIETYKNVNILTIGGQGYYVSFSNLTGPFNSLEKCRKIIDKSK